MKTKNTMKPTNLPTALANHFQQLLDKKKKHITVLQAYKSMERISMIADYGQRETQVNQLLDLIKESDHIKVPVYDHFIALSEDILAKK